MSEIKGGLHKVRELAENIDYDPSCGSGQRDSKEIIAIIDAILEAKKQNASSNPWEQSVQNGELLEQITQELTDERY